MNELRMYVEHLFEGKVLTPENIELKEEIYGSRCPLRGFDRQWLG